MTCSDSGFLAEPMHKLECCLVTDGAAAIVVTSAERARSLAKPAVYVLGAASAASHAMISQMPDLTITPGAVSGPAAFATAGLTPGTVDVVQLYDSFTITVLLALEDLGFCEKGEGGPFVGDGVLAPGGALPGQTSGRWAGVHPPRGVRRLPARRGHPAVAGRLRRPAGRGRRRRRSAHGTGGVLSATSTVILGTEATAMSAAFPVPEPSTVSAPFWDGTEKHQLVMQRCESCHRLVWYPRLVCPHCGAVFDCAGSNCPATDVVYAVSVHHRAAHPAFADRVPYSVVLVDLDEGARMMSNVFGPPPDVGDAVSVAWLPLADGRNLPTFECAMSADS